MRRKGDNCAIEGNCSGTSRNAILDAMPGKKHCFKWRLHTIKAELAIRVHHKLLFGLHCYVFCRAAPPDMMEQNEERH